MKSEIGLLLLMVIITLGVGSGLGLWWFVAAVCCILWLREGSIDLMIGELLLIGALADLWWIKPLGVTGGVLLIGFGLAYSWRKILPSESNINFGIFCGVMTIVIYWIYGERFGLVDIVFVLSTCLGISWIKIMFGNDRGLKPRM